MEIMIDGNAITTFNSHVDKFLLLAVHQVKQVFKKLISQLCIVYFLLCDITCRKQRTSNQITTQNRPYSPADFRVLDVQPTLQACLSLTLQLLDGFSQ